MAKNQTRAAGSLVSPFRTARKGLGLGFETEYSKKRDGFFPATAIPRLHGHLSLCWSGTQKALKCRTLPASQADAWVPFPQTFSASLQSPQSTRPQRTTPPSSNPNPLYLYLASLASTGQRAPDLHTRTST